MKANAGLRHLSLKTRDLEKTVRFYTEVLGLEIAFKVPPKKESSFALRRPTISSISLKPRKR